MKCIVTRYGEIGLKSTWVRREFEQKLVDNISACLVENGIEIDKIRQKGARNYIFCDNYPKALKVLKKVFGLVSYSLAEIVDSDLNEICKKAVQIYKKESGKKAKTFRVTTNRSKDFPMKSMEVSAKVGEYVINETGAKVDLTKYDININIEIRGKKSYVFVSKERGFGGLPIGSTGKVLSLLSDKNSMLASWLMMRRGCKVHLVHFGKKSKELEKMFKQLKNYYYCDEPMELEYVKEEQSSDKIIDLAKRTGSEGIVSGTKKLSSVSKEPLPVFRPVLCLDKKNLKQLVASELL